MDSRGPRFGSLWLPVAAFRDGHLPLKEDCRLHSCRFVRWKLPEAFCKILRDLECQVT